MSTHKIRFYEETSKIIPKLSSNIKYAPYLVICFILLLVENIALVKKADKFIKTQSYLDLPK